MQSALFCRETSVSDFKRCPSHATNLVSTGNADHSHLLLSSMLSCISALFTCECASDRDWLMTAANSDLALCPFRANFPHHHHPVHRVLCCDSLIGKIQDVIERPDVLILLDCELRLHLTRTHTRTRSLQASRMSCHLNSGLSLRLFQTLRKVFSIDRRYSYNPPDTT